VAGQIERLPQPISPEPRNPAVVVLPPNAKSPPTPHLLTQSDKAQTAAPETNQKEKSEANNSASPEKEPHSGENGFAHCIKPKREDGGFFFRFYKAYYDEFFPSKKENGEEEPEKPRRALPSPWDSPPFPSSEYQGYPLIGVPPPDPGQYPIMKAIYGANTDWS